MGGDIYQGSLTPRLEICGYQQYLSITSRFDDVLPPGNRRGFRYRPGSEKRALPARVERPFRFGR